MRCLGLCVDEGCITNTLQHCGGRRISDHGNSLLVVLLRILVWRECGEGGSCGHMDFLVHHYSSSDVCPLKEIPSSRGKGE